MRTFSLLVALTMFFLLGCNDSPPKGKRGELNESGNKDNAKIDDAGGPVQFEGLTLTAPKGWGRKAPQSTFILGEFVLPRAEGDTLDGRLTLSVAGGTIDENIARWKGQFVGKLEKSHQEKLDANGLTATLVDFSGEFNDQRGPNAPAVKRPDFRMIAAIIPVGDQLHFVKATGPRKTMDHHADKIKAFIASAKK